MTTTDEPIYTADVIALASFDGQLHVALIQRDWPPYEGHWGLPGGHIDPGEKPHVAGSREAWEEARLDVDPDTMRYLDTWDTRGRDPRGNYVTFVYVIAMDEPEPVHADSDARDARWILVSELDSLPLAFDHREILLAGLRTTG